MTRILLIGTELPLLEGLAQGFATLGFESIVATSLAEGRDIAAQAPPLVAVVSRTLAAVSSAEMLSIPLVRGGALMLYRQVGSPLVSFPPSVQRAVMADLALPLERNRLMAMVHHLDQRARTSGRGSDDASEMGLSGEGRQ